MERRPQNWFVEIPRTLLVFFMEFKGAATIFWLRLKGPFDSFLLESRNETMEDQMESFAINKDQFVLKWFF